MDARGASASGRGLRLIITGEAAPADGNPAYGDHRGTTAQTGEEHDLERMHAPQHDLVGHRGHPERRNILISHWPRGTETLTLDRSA